MNDNSDEDTAVFGDDDDGEGLPRLVGYQVLEFIEQDGLHVVYRARQVSLGRDVAIRTNRGVADEAQAAHRLIEEAAILSKLQHPHIVSILDCIDRRGRIHLVFEYAAGGTLASRVDGQPQPPVLAAGIVERLARTLDFIHRCGITHCDLKPRNVLLAAPPSNETTPQTDSPNFEDVYGIPLIDGFGLAIDDQRRATLKEGQIQGTPVYMAPEQLKGRWQDIGPPADIYCLGVILYKLLTGQSPFHGRISNLDNLRELKGNEEPEPAWKVNPNVNRRLGAICQKCLRPQPESRYLTALDLAQDLREFLKR